VLLWLVGGALPAAAASLIVNGSFETTSQDPGGTCVELLAGNTSITGWEVSGVAVHHCDPQFWPGSDGARTVDLDGNSDYGGVRQSFATDAGQTYTVTFDMAGNYYGDPTLKRMQLSADGQSAIFQFDATGRTYDDFGWTPMSWSFVADDASATLEFLSLTPSSGFTPSYGAVIDNVVVTPEPATFGSLLLGLLGIAALRRSA
jgi:choice-of-anchor C domain-containing protein